MTEVLLTDNDQKERLSVAYASALAACAGYVTSVPVPDLDSVDLRIQAGGEYRPALDVQLKATSTDFAPLKNRPEKPFPLPIKNYNDLRVETQTPRLLVILKLPKNQVDWLTVTMEELALRGCAYWLSLQQGYDGVIGQQTVTVHIPEGNVLNVETLQDLMERSRKGDL